MAALRVGRAVSKARWILWLKEDIMVFGMRLWDIDIDEWNPEEGEPEINHQAKEFHITGDLCFIGPIQ